MRQGKKGNTMARSEAEILKAVMVEASRLGMRVFRNNVGLFETADGRKIRTGLFKGSGDLIGWYKGTFVSIEVKRKGGKPSKEQINWHNQVLASGGFSCIIDDEKKLKKMLTDYIEMR